MLHTRLRLDSLHLYYTLKPQNKYQWTMLPKHINGNQIQQIETLHRGLKQTLT